MSIYYVHIMFKKCQEHIKIIFVRDQKQNKKICENENNSFYFIRTKIKICYIYMDEKLI